MEDEIRYSSGVIVLTSLESKRLIAKAVAELPEVRAALDHGRLIIATGTTNGFVAEEILGPVFAREEFVTGHVIDGRFAASGATSRLEPFVLDSGERTDTPWTEAIEEFGAQDVFIKGANAVDSEGFAGVLIGHPLGGTIGTALPIINARGAHLIMPVGLEKLVPSVVDASRALCGIKQIEHTLDGYSVGYIPVMNATVITELEALEILFELDATQLAGGGIVGSEGSVALLIEGSEDQVSECMEFIRQIKGEPQLKRPV